MKAFTQWLQSLSRRGERKAAPIDPCVEAARTLAAAGHAKREAERQAAKRAFHDDMAARIGLPPIQWGEG
jgi:hypothetical protein